jgi:hypothetical protein
MYGDVQRTAVLVRANAEQPSGIAMGLSSDLSLSPSQLTRPPNLFSSSTSSILLIVYLDTNDATKGTQEGFRGESRTPDERPS